MFKKRYLPFLIVSLFFLLRYRLFFFDFPLVVGDIDFHFNDVMGQFGNNAFSAWYSYLNFGQSHIQLCHAILRWMEGMLFILGFDFNDWLRLCFYFPVTILMPLGIYRLASLEGISVLGRLVAVLIYSLNGYILSIESHHAHLHIVVVYALAPWFLYFLTHFLKGNIVLHYGFGLTVVMALSMMYEPRYFYLVISIGIMKFFFHFLLHWNFRIFRRCLGYGWVSSVVALGLNLFWILPLISGFSVEAGAIAGRDLFGSKFYSLFQSLVFHYPFWNGETCTIFKVNAIPFWMVILPVIAFSVVLMKKKSTHFFYLLLGILGIFLSKQSDHPLPLAYGWLYTHFPGFGFFREASKFYLFLGISFSILCAFGIDFLKNIIPNIKGSRWASITCALLISLPFIQNGWSCFTGTIGGIYEEKAIPGEFLKLKGLLENQPGYFRTLWIPGRPMFGYLSIEKPALSLNYLVAVGKEWRFFFNSKYLYSFVMNPFLELLFNAGNIKYIVLMSPRKDDELGSSTLGESIAQMRSQKFLREVKIGAGQFFVFENVQFHDLFYTANDVFLTCGSLRLLENLFQAGLLNKFCSFVLIEANGLKLLNQENVIRLFRQVLLPLLSDKKNKSMDAWMLETRFKEFPIRHYKALKVRAEMEAAGDRVAEYDADASNFKLDIAGDDYLHSHIVYWHRENLSRYSISVRSDGRPFWLIFSDSFSKKWHAYILDSKGQKRDLGQSHFQVNGWQNGWRVGPGESLDIESGSSSEIEILVEYESARVLEKGLAISTATLLTFMGFALFAILPRRVSNGKVSERKRS